jgi:FlaA1/EpsC-like NDP-sugar epimerase
MRVLLLFLFLTLLYGTVYLLAYLIRFDGAVPASMWKAAIAALPTILAVKLVLSFALGSHRGWWRYATFADMVIIAECTTLSFLVLVVLDLFDRSHLMFPRSILLIDWAGSMMFLSGVRVATRLLRERYHPMVMSRSGKRAVVVGANQMGVALAHEACLQSRLNLRIMGFLDTDPHLHHRTIAGIPVWGSPAEIIFHAARHQIETVLVAGSSLGGPELRELVVTCGKVGLKVQVVPGLDSLLAGNVKVEPRDVDIQDLLNREPICLDGESIGQLLEGRVVLVTGAAGSIGSEICRQILPFRPSRLVLLDHNENGLFFVERELRALAPDVELLPCVASITDASRLRTMFEKQEPEVVFHAAAHKHVPMMEANPGEAVKNNVFGTRTLVDEAIHAGVEALVMISTDKAVNPTSVMGACKRVAEMYVQAMSKGSSCRLVTVRFGNVLGSNGSVVPIFKEQIRRGGPVTITHSEMTRFFMTIPEAAQLVLQAGTLGEGGEIFVLDMGEQVRIVDLAKDLIRLSGLQEGRDIEIAFTGLRPGEKLYEELYDDGEIRLPTPHPKIFRARHRESCPERLRDGFARLSRHVNASPENVLRELRSLVPEYRPPSHLVFAKTEVRTLEVSISHATL